MAAEDLAHPLNQVDECATSIAGLCISNKVDLGLVVSVALFVIGLFVSNWIERRKKDRDRLEAESKASFARRKYLVALSEEIGLNVESIQKAIQVFPPASAIAAFMRRSKRNRPLITFSFYSTIFKGNTEILQDLPDIMIRSIVEFYGQLDAICVDCLSVNSPAFTTISFDGRDNTLADINSQQKVALQHGKSIRDAITQHLKDKYPDSAAGGISSLAKS